MLATDQTVVFWNRRAREILGYTPDRMIGRRCSGVDPGDGSDTLTGDCQLGCPMMSRARAGLMPGRARLKMRCSWGEWKWLLVTPMVVSGLEDGGPLLIYLFGDSDEKANSADISRLVELGGGAVDGPRQIPEDDPRPDSFRSSPWTPDPEFPDGWLDWINSGAGFDPSAPDDLPGNDHSPAQSPALASQIAPPDYPLDDYALQSDSAGLDEDPDAARLTKREREALSYLALGWKTRTIAEEMGVSPHTARNHIENLRRKLDASNRLEAVMTAMRRGIIPAE